MDRNSSKALNLVIKVKHGDTLRRFGASVNGEAMDIDMANLKAKIIGRFKFKPNAQIVLTYTDEDGDTVTLDNDEELRDAVVTQRLNPLRINVQLISADPQEGLVREPSGSPPIVTQPSHINSAFSELLKSVQKPLLSKVTRVSNDVVSKAASASPVMADIFDQISKLGYSTGGEPSQAHGGSSVAPEVVAADLKDFNTIDTIEAANSNNQVKEKNDKHYESGNLTQDVHIKTANRVDVGVFHAMQNKASNDMLSSDWTIGNVSHERDLGGHHDRKGKAVIDTDVSAPPLTGSNEDKQSPNFGTPLVYDESFDNINKQSPFSSASLASLIHPNAQTGFPGYTGIALSDVPLPDDFTSPLHPYRRGRRFDNGSRTFHRGIRCDGCGMHPIMGPRFKSKLKEDYDLCGICFVEMGNETDYTRIDRAPHHSPRLFKEPFNRLPQHRPAVPGCILRPYKMKLESCFVKDVTVLDGTVIPPSSPFTKIWRMRNNGNIAWPCGTRLVWIGGNHQLGMQRPIQLEIPASGFPVDEELDIAVDFVSPSRPGRYISYWRMASPTGQKFGQRVWVLIQVDNSQPSTGGFYNTPINLNLPPETVGRDGVRIIDVNAEPQEDAASVNGMIDELVNPFANDVAMQTSEPAPVDVLLGMDNTNGFITQPMPPPVPLPSFPFIDFAASSTESAGEPAGSTPQGNPLEQAMMKELEEMGFNEIDLNKEVLRLNKYDLEQSVDDLCGFAEWDPLIQELQAMGFDDKQKNKKLLIKNGGSIKRAVLDLIAGEKPE